MFSYRIVLRPGLIVAAAIGLFLLSNSANAQGGVSSVTPVAGSDFTRGQMAFSTIDGNNDAGTVALSGVGNGSVSIEFYSADGVLIGTALGVMPNDSVGNILQISFIPHMELGESSCVQDFFR